MHVGGELDLAMMPDLENVISGLDPSDSLVFDLTGCTFLDSSALRAILSAARSAREAGGEVSLVAQAPGLLRILEIATIDTLVPVYPTVEAALDPS